MNVARLNMSHGSQAWHEGAITTLRRVAKRKGMPIAILVDLQGPRIRVGSLVGGGMPLESGQSVNVVGRLTGWSDGADDFDLTHTG